MQRPRARTQASPAASSFPLRFPVTSRFRRHPRCPSKPAARYGLSLPRGGCPSPDHLCGINVPGLHLRHTAGCVPARPLPRSSVPFPGGWPAQGFVATHPVSLTVPRLSAPLRDLSIPPDHRSLRFAARKLAFAGRPLSVPPRCCRIAPAASAHRFGFAASRLARQLRKPLGTSIIVHWNGTCGQYGRWLSYNVFRRFMGLSAQSITLVRLWNSCG